MNKTDIFAIRPTNEEQNDFIVTVGRHLATEKHFETKEDAERYLNEFHWDTHVAVMAEMIDISRQKDENPTMINNGINKNERK